MPATRSLSAQRSGEPQQRRIPAAREAKNAERSAEQPASVPAKPHPARPLLSRREPHGRALSGISEQHARHAIKPSRLHDKRSAPSSRRHAQRKRQRSRLHRFRKNDAKDGQNSGTDSKAAIKTAQAPPRPRESGAGISKSGTKGCAGGKSHGKGGSCHGESRC